MTIKILKNKNLRGFKLVIASVSTGNVGQLTADLLINSLSMEKIALMFSPAIIPMIGPSAFSDASGDLSTASEFFISEKNKIVLLLIRSPVNFFYVQSLCDEIIDFIKSEGIIEVIQLSSAFSYEQHFVDQNPFEFVSNEIYQVTESISHFNKSTQSKIPGCGIAIKLHDIATTHQIPSIVLFKYVSEGDNTFDAMQFASKINKLFDQPIPEKEGKVDLKVPISWRHMFGHNPNTEIY